MGIGIDLLNIKEFKTKLDSPEFLKKVFHPNELRHKYQLPSIFALKEATIKAIGKKINWKNIEISYTSAGKPLVQVINNASKFSCSVSHDKNYLIAIVIQNYS